MGSYAAYTEAMNIPPERFPTFNRYMEKILNYGGIIWRYNRKVMQHCSESHTDVVFCSM